VGKPFQVSLEDAIHNVDVIQDSDSVVDFGWMGRGIEASKGPKEFLIRPCLVGEQQPEVGGGE
jgi:hypothetical protein